MQRSSLGLRIPAGLLPSSRGPDSDSQSDSHEGSVDSELKGLAWRQVGLSYGRSASGPAAARQPPPSEAALHRSATSASLAAKSARPNSAAATTITVHADASSSLGEVQGAASRTNSLPRDQTTAAPPRHAVERMGSRLGQAADAAAQYSAADEGVSVKGIPTAAASPTKSEPASVAGSRATSPAPDCYSDDAFESDRSSQRPTSPGSTVQTGGMSSVSAKTDRRAAVRASSGKVSQQQVPSRSPSCASSRTGYRASTAATRARRPASSASTKPCSPSPQKQLQPRPCSPSPAEGHPREALEARVGKQMQRDPAEWTVREVCDWLELVGLGQYRRRFVHNAVSGSLLLRLSNEELKTDVGIAPLGHREALLAAIHDLDQFWRQQLQQQAEQQRLAAENEYSDEWGDGRPGSGSPGASRPGSPPPRLADYSLQRAYTQRAKLMRELEKAESREAQRRVAAEQAMRVVGQATDEVRKLQATICELDRDLGWQAAAEQQHFDPLDVHGAVAWQPAGIQRAPPRPRSGSPAHYGCPGSPSSGGGSTPGSPMSRVSRRIMAEKVSSGGGGFLDRLGRDIAARQAKAAEARRQAGRYLGGAQEQLLEQERELRDIAFAREMVEARSGELAEKLASGDDALVAEACDAAVESYQQDWGLDKEAVAAVRRLGSGGKKAARLAGALRSAQFMQRLETDLSSREGRLRELQQKFYKLEAGNCAEQQERADLAAAQKHFRLLGWSAADLDVQPGDQTASCDELLGALLKRAAALQEAREHGKKAVDWEAASWKGDKLDEMQRDQNVALQAALEEQKAALAAAAADMARGKRNYTQSVHVKELPEPKDRVLETAQLLAACRPAEVALLEGLSGHRKLLMTWRAVRAQQFIAFTRQDMEQRRAKAAALEKQVYPGVTKVLPKEEFDAFFDRLMNDTARRAQHRDELAEAAKLEALAKLKGSAPPPLTHQRKQPQPAKGAGK